MNFRKEGVLFVVNPLDHIFPDRRDGERVIIWKLIMIIEKVKGYQYDEFYVVEDGKDAIEN